MKKSALHYDQFFGPLYFEPYAVEVAERIEPAHVSIALEIAAGTGRVTRHIRERIPASARLIASDISDEMLSVAKEKLKHLEIDWQNIDAQELPFADNGIDLVVCCFGYMFVPDKPKAFAEVFRVLKPGGQFLFTTWDKLEENAASYLYRLITQQYVEQPLSKSADEPTSMSDESLLRQFLVHAGFSKISIERLGLSFISPTAKEAAAGFVDGDTSLKSSLSDEIKLRVEKEFTEKFGAEPMIAPMSAFMGRAWK